MSFKSSIANAFRNFATWIEDTEKTPAVENFNACAACDGIKFAQTILQDAVTKLQSMLQTVITNGQTKMAQDVTSVCAKCTATPTVPTASTAPTAPPK